MSLTADAEIVSGKSWSKQRKLLLALAALPLLAYTPGFFLGLPNGFATSLPFWADAQDYTCSTTRVRSLMVRISPYATNGAPKKMNDWDCARIHNFRDRDIAAGERPWLNADENGQVYVRIYTPYQPARAQLPPTPIPEDMQNRVISLARVTHKAAPAAPPKPISTAPQPIWSTRP